jgi:hypothetical protein
MGESVALDDLIKHVHYIKDNKISGAVVECGTWRGGCLAFLIKSMEMLDDPRTAWAFDSFEGMPEPGTKDGKTEHEWWYEGWCKATVEEFWETMEMADIDKASVRAVKGWFDESFDKISNKEVGPISILRLDSDWYESQMACLIKWWPNVSPGGLVISDDYHVWQGDKQAFDEFLSSLPSSSFEFFQPVPHRAKAYVKKLW